MAGRRKTRRVQCCPVRGRGFKKGVTEPVLYCWPPRAGENRASSLGFSSLGAIVTFTGPVLTDLSGKGLAGEGSREGRQKNPRKKA